MRDVVIPAMVNETPNPMAGSNSNHLKLEQNMTI